MLRAKLSLLLVAFVGFFSLSTLGHAQTYQAPPAAAPAPLWAGYYPGDPENWPTPEAACKAQHDHYNPTAVLDPPTYRGARGIATCNWHGGTVILPASAYAHCPTGWTFYNWPGVCVRSDAVTDSRAQCGCDGPPAGTPSPTTGNPIALNYGAKIDHEVDYVSADGRFSVDRNYYSLGEDHTNLLSPTSIAGFGGRWHGIVPGRLALSGNNGDNVEYLDPDGSFARFDADTANNLTSWTWHTVGATRRRLSMVSTPTSDRLTFFYSEASVANGPAEIRMDMAGGEYILFRRAGVPEAPSVGPRYLVPVEHGYADGYRLYYTYPDTGEFPSTVTDSLGRQMTLTWVDADRLTHTYLSTWRPVKVISEVLLPDNTKLQYNYGYGVDDFGSQIRNRLEGVKHVSGAGATLWARNYLYENSALPNALTGKVDQNGNRLSTYAYDAAGLATSTELAGGVDKYTVANLESTDKLNFLRQVTNPLGHRIDYVFHKASNTNTAQRVLSATTDFADTNVEAASTSYQYSGSAGSQAISNFTDERALTLHLDVDSQLRPTLSREASGTTDARTTNLTWHPTFDLVTHEDRPGLSVDYVYGTTGLLQSMTQTDTTTQTVPYATTGQTRTWTYSWNGNGRLLSIDGPKGLDVNGKADITSFGYDTGGNLLTSTDALGYVTTFADYDANGRPGKMIDPNGINTLYGYDLLGRLTTITVKSPAGVADDRITTLDYDTEGRVTGVTAPGTQKLIVDYDLAGQVTAIRIASGEKIAFTHDAMGNVTLQSVKRANGTTAREISRTFDGLGRMLTETLGTNRTTTMAYDKLGNLTSVTSANSNATVKAFDGLNRLVSSIAPDTGESKTGYDVFDQTTKFTDPIAVQTTYVRNGFGDVIQEVSPDRGTSTYYYDAAGDVTASIDGRGQRVDIVRDALGRIMSKTPAGRPASEIVTYGYDTDVFGGGSYAKGRLNVVLDGTGKTQFKYDFRGNVLIKRMKAGALAPADLTYSYDAAGRVQGITYPSGRIVSYARDTLGRVTSVTTQANASAPVVTLVSGITYEPFGSMLAATYGNGLSLVQSWGNDGRLATKRLYATGTSTNLSSLTYGYDNNDNLISIVDNVDSTRTLQYGYDTVDRLRKTVVWTGSLKRQDIAYDLNGNRISVEQRVERTDLTPVSTATYTLNSGTNQLASISDPGGTRSISYDARGNTLGETRPDGTTITVDYDGYARLTSYAASGSLALLNSYNGLDERVAAGTSLDMRHFVYDNDGRLMGEYGSSATDVKAETIWLSPELNASERPIGGDDGVGGYAPLALATGSGDIYWVHGSHLGVPLVTTDAAGNLAAPTGFTRVGFPGQTRTLDDLYYNRYRDYDPTTGRYIQADPIGLEGGANPYIYAENSPLRWTDPMGLDPIGSAIGGAIGGWVGGGAAAGVCVETGPGAIVCGAAGRWAGRKLGSAAGDAIGDWVKGAVTSCNKPEDPCKEKIAKIYRYMNEVKERTEALRIDKYNLYNLARANPSPSLPKGTGSWNGHIHQLIGWRNGLRNAIREAIAARCKVPPEAWKLAYGSIPSRPGR